MRVVCECEGSELLRTQLLTTQDSKQRCHFHFFWRRYRRERWVIMIACDFGELINRKKKLKKSRSIGQTAIFRNCDVFHWRAKVLFRFVFFLFLYFCSPHLRIRFCRSISHFNLPVHDWSDCAAIGGAHTSWYGDTNTLHRLEYYDVGNTWPIALAPPYIFNANTK